VQYTGNMATGASTADLALVVLDVASGLKEQTRRHLCIAALLGVRSIIVAVNKMDSVDWSKLPLTAWSTRFKPSRATSISRRSRLFRCRPCSATTSWRVRCTSLVRRSHGPQALESSEAGAWEHTTTRGARLPSNGPSPIGRRSNLRGMVNGDTFRVGDRVTLLPANIETTITAINFGGQEISEATVGLAAASR